MTRLSASVRPSVTNRTTRNKMTTALNIIIKTIFWLTIIFIVVAFYGLTFGQSFNYEFADWKTSRKFYDIIMQGLPFAILLTLVGTIKRTNNKSKNIINIVLTVLVSIISFFIVVSMLFSVGFLTIYNETTFYRNKNNPDITITAQRIGQGALGADGHRIVRLEPYMKFWNKVTLIDTTSINRTEWNLVNEKIEN